VSEKIIVDFTHTPDPVDEFLDTVVGPDYGYLAVGFGYGPKIKKKGDKRPWKERTFKWPEQREEARREIALMQRQRWDVYFCPALMASVERSRHNAAQVWTLSFELDEEPANPELLDKLDAVLVESGTSGHLHVHTLLAESVHSATADRLTEVIAKTVAGWVPGSRVILKWEANALLRVPDSWNWKSYWAKDLPARRRSNDAAPRGVRVVKAEGKRWSVDELEALISSLSTRPVTPKRRQGARTQSAQAITEGDLSQYPGVRRALQHWANPDDRSDAHEAVTRECYKANAPQEAAVSLILAQPWCKGHEKWVRDDVARIYKKAAQEGLEQIPGKDFWDQRTMLTHIRDYAYERSVSPWAMLGVTLLRVAQTIPPYKVLPDIVGDYGSLNQVIAICSETGGGKSTSASAAVRAMPIEGEGQEHVIGTGPGMTRPYARPGKDGVLEPKGDAALFTSDEVDTFQQELNRPGSNLSGQISTAWSGQGIGATNKRDENNVTIPAHTYRFGLYVGVQPELSDALLAPNRRNSGFAQRWLWFDGDLPDDAEVVDEYKIEPRAWTPPHEPDYNKLLKFDRPRPGEEFEVIEVPLLIRRLVKEDRINRRRKGGVDEDTRKLDSHRMLNRLKLAAVLMWLDGRDGTQGINDGDWDLAGQIMAQSDHTRERAQLIYNKDREKRGNQQAQRTGRYSAITEEAREAHQIKRATEVILKLLATGPRTVSHLTTRGMTASLRPVAKQALVELKRSNKVEVQKTTTSANGDKVVWYQLVEDTEGV